MNLLLRPPEQRMEGRLQGVRSKSLSNRLLILSALEDHLISTESLSSASDTLELHRALEHPAEIHTLEGGTSYRFLLAYRFAIDRPVTLYPKGSLKGRPMAPLVDALKQLGGRFQYLEMEGQGPIRFHGRSRLNKPTEVRIDCSISSQFASALMLIAPTLEQPLSIRLSQRISSRSYLNMTLQLMRRAGIELSVEHHQILCRPSNYSTAGIEVEGDWSAASFFYALAGLMPKTDIFIPYLRRESLQPDRILGDWFRQWNVATDYEQKGIRITHPEDTLDRSKQRLDFNDHPDLALPVLIFCTLQAIPVRVTGLQTLPHKESDRLSQVKKIVRFLKGSLEKEGAFHHLHVPEAVPDYSGQSYSSEGDHRIAMSLSLLAARHELCVKGAGAVEKSYPHFWKDLEQPGFVIRECQSPTDP